MIIVSQDKMMIINFNNIEYIKVRKLPVNEIGYAISIETLSNNFDRFAIYDTEERAKEVFKEIAKNISGFYKEVTHGIYYMPEE